ncbi:hypothetical protein FRB96_000118 [Tulasnella sp. 330]|nr:hypothetical protein FRB96_000118 [Tulasnella sp. 330]KAG8882935.1 hypothetical protein FRB97_007531 [Tulasnella sp. 331]KAG8891019.1 hypothetical protein FRB98_000028 [Tulasnella sp. 332]
MSTNDDAALTARFQATLPYHLLRASPALASLHASRNQLLNGGPKPVPSSCTRCGNFFASCTLVSKRRAPTKPSNLQNKLEGSKMMSGDIHLMVICRKCGKRDTKSVADVSRRPRVEKPSAHDKSKRKIRAAGKESTDQTLTTITDTLASETKVPPQVKEKKLQVPTAVPWKTSSSKARVTGGLLVRGVQSSTVTSDKSSVLPTRKARGGLEGMLERKKQEEARKQLGGESKLSDFLQGLDTS